MVIGPVRQMFGAEPVHRFRADPPIPYGRASYQASPDLR
jgi:hypothetical protein